MNKKHIQKQYITALKTQLDLYERQEQEALAAAQILANKMRHYQQQCKQLDDTLNEQISINKKLLEQVKNQDDYCVKTGLMLQDLHHLLLGNNDQLLLQYAQIYREQQGAKQ